MEFIAGLKEGFVGQLGAVLKVGEVRAARLSEMEVNIKAMLHEVGGEVLRQALEAQDEGYPADEEPCGCGQQARYVRRREGVSVTLLGRVHYHRAY